MLYYTYDLVISILATLHFKSLIIQSYNVVTQSTIAIAIVLCVNSNMIITLCGYTYVNIHCTHAIQSYYKIFSWCTKVHSGQDDLNEGDNTLPGFMLQQIWCNQLSQKSHEICNIDKCINAYTQTVHTHS